MEQFLFNGLTFFYESKKDLINFFLSSSYNELQKSQILGLKTVTDEDYIFEKLKDRKEDFYGRYENYFDFMTFRLSCDLTLKQWSSQTIENKCQFVSKDFLDNLNLSCIKFLFFGDRIKSELIPFADHYLAGFKFRDNCKLVLAVDMTISKYSKLNSNGFIFIGTDENLVLKMIEKVYTGNWNEIIRI